MNETSKILFADDEETFLHSTTDLLRREGYECDCASNGGKAVEMLKAAKYDVLIADIKMPGNLELELVGETSRIAEGIPIILVTGYPSLNSAIQSIQLPVLAYLVKPFEFEELLEQVKVAVVRHQTYHTIHNARQRLKDWHEDMDKIDDLISKAPRNASSIRISTFFSLTIQNIVNSLLDLRSIVDEHVMNNDVQYVCNLLECPRLSVLKDGLVESIDVLNKTKGTFKSKDLGVLRKKLETLVKKD
jgi:CheY-like chemotaxis protein